MVHGMTQDHRVFSAQVKYFQNEFRLLLVDLPGHGRSADVAGPYGHWEMMQHVRSALDQVAVGPVHYWATHTGTALGLLLAADEPERFHSLILEGAVVSGASMPYISETLSSASATAKADGIHRAIHDIFYQAGWYEILRKRPQECRAEEHLKILLDFKGAPWTEDHTAAPANLSDEALAQIHIPTLVYNGAHELEDFISIADKLEKRIPNVERAIIPRAGGFPAWEYPDEVNELVRDFLSRQSPHTRRVSPALLV